MRVYLKKSRNEVQYDIHIFITANQSIKTLVFFVDDDDLH